MQNLEINSILDLEQAKKMMLLVKSDINIESVNNLEYTIKLDGGRFSDFDLTYINADIANIILDYQTQYNAFVSGLEQKFNIQIPQSQKMLKFKLEKGCLEISTDIKEIFKEGIKHMSGWQTMVVFIVAVGGWYANDSYHKYIQKQEKEIELQKQQLSEKAEQERLETIARMVSNLSSDRSLQEPANRMKKSIASVLHDDEKAFIAPEIPEQAELPLTSADKDKFRVVLPQEELPSLEEEIDGVFHIEAQHFTPNKIFRIKELKLNVSSTPISATKRMDIIKKADKQEPISLKIKLIKNAKTGNIEEALILDVIN